MLSNEKRVSRFGFIRGALTAALLMTSLVAAQPIGAQEMECDTDPAVNIRADDGNMITVHVHYRASLLLPNGQTVAMSSMATHLLTKSIRPVMTATNKGMYYDIRVQTKTDHWTGVVPFQVKVYLVHKPTGVVGNITSGMTGSVITSNVALPAGVNTVVVVADTSW